MTIKVVRIDIRQVFTTVTIMNKLLVAFIHMYLYRKQTMIAMSC